VKTIHGDGWVLTRPWFNKKFFTEGYCQICKSFSCAPGWLQLGTKKFRCAKCFDATKEPYVPLSALKGLRVRVGRGGS
jgi:hypothetical protein